MSETAGKVIKCRAAIAWEPSKPLSVEDIEVAPPKEGEVRVKILATGVCHTDVTFMGGYSRILPFPCIFGHEGSGIVESVGEGVTSFQPGDHVIPLYVPQCGTCAPCKGNKTNLCEKVAMTLPGSGVLQDGTSRFTCKGKPVHHFMGCSTFSQYTVVMAISLCKINPKANLEKVCLLGCGVSTGYGAALNTAKVEEGTTVAIWGLGGVGLAAAMGAREAGAKRIIGIDIKPEKFEIAKKFGCTEFLNPKDHPDKGTHEVILGMTGGGLDYAFECVGNVQTMRAAMESLKSYGKAVLIGAPSNPTLEFSIPPLNFLLGKTCTGSIFGGWKRDDVPKIVEKYLGGKLMLDDFITSEVKLEEINKAFDLLHEGKGIRTIVHL